MKEVFLFLFVNATFLLKSGTEWSEEEYAMLAKAVAKFPGGTSGRWEKISEMVGRPVSEVKKIFFSFNVTIPNTQIK